MTRSDRLWRLGLGSLFATAGLFHFLTPRPFVDIVPPWLPWPGALVAISGAAEILGAVGLVWGRTRRAAGWWLIALLVAVFPANVQMLVDAHRSHAAAWWLVALWLRLPLQILLIRQVYCMAVQHDSPVATRGLARTSALAITVVAALTSAACANPLYVVGMKFVYKRAPLPASQIFKDIPYAAPSDSPKQRLDLYTPASRGWPVVVFIHGGNWTEGDRGLTVGGADVYGNIGRFLAQHGYGTAVISYRLIPGVDWQAQADDVAMALKWVDQSAPGYGARRGSIVVMGHSAGAQLAVRAALDEERLSRIGVPRSAIQGIIAVSGAGYDLTDEPTYALGNDPAFYAQRFRRSAADAEWRRGGSVLPLRVSNAPPALVMWAERDSPSLKRQSALLVAALDKTGAKTTSVEAPGVSHTRIVPTLSRADRTAGSAILKFLGDTVPRSAGPRSAEPR